MNWPQLERTAGKASGPLLLGESICESISEPVLNIPLPDGLCGLPCLQDILLLASVLALAWLALE